MKLSIEDVHDNNAFRIECKGDFKKILDALSILVHSVAQSIELKPSMLLMMIQIEIDKKKDALDNSIRIDLENERDTN